MLAFRTVTYCTENEETPITKRLMSQNWPYPGLPSRPAGAALTLTLEGQRGRRDVDTWGAAADFGLVEPSRRPPRRPKCLIGMELSTEVVDNPVRNPAPVLTLEGRPY